MPDGVPPVGNGLHFQHWFLPDHIIGFGQIYKRPFGMDSIQKDGAFDDEFRIRLE